MTPGKYDFVTANTGEVIPHRRGDSFPGHTFTITEDGNPVDFTGATAILQVKKDPNLAAVLEWSTENETLSFNSNQVIMAARTGAEMDIRPYNYVYDLQITLADGTVNTYVEGYFKIVNDVSR